MSKLEENTLNSSYLFSSFPDTRYMGSKRKLLPSLHGVFEQLDFQTSLDAFSGTSSVAYLLKSIGKSVDTNDYLMFNYFTAKALIENNESILTKEDVRDICTFNEDKDNFIEKNFSDIYYSRRDCKWLDSASANIAFISDPYKKAIALTALCRACIKKRPRGIFTYTGMRYDDGRKDLKLEIADQFAEAVRKINHSIVSSKKKCIAYNQDIMKFKKTRYDLVYFDPPYFSLKSDSEYSRRYHFLEGLVSYWSHVHINHETKTRKFDRIQSDFNHRSKIIPAFETLFDKFADSQIVLSYSSNCFPDADILRSLLKNEGKAVELVEVDYVYSVGTHSHKKNNESNRVKEYIFLGL